MQSTQRSEHGGIFSFFVLEERPGFILFEVSGKKAWETFKNEGGGHRWQRIPPTEKRDRVQTSTVTCAVFKEILQTELKINDSDLEIKTCRASGKGGQHLQKTDSAVQIKHLPSGLMVRCESERSQLQNKETAMSILRNKLLELKEQEEIKKINQDRKSQLGSGQRGDKIRTYREQDDLVIDHRSDKKMKFSRLKKGFIEDLE